jgi:putative transposase
MTKRLGALFNFFQFKERLKYKCKRKSTNYKEVNESYTSKCCYNCSNYNKELGSSKIYDCSNCKLKIGRDINAPINIMIKAL